jgi:hypothetical protein
MDAAPRFAWLNPEVGLYLGYCVHVAGDELARGTPRAQLAEQEADRLLALAAEPGCADDVFLSQARAVIVSYAGAITRHKRMLLQEIGAAKEEHEGHRRRIAGGRVFAIAWAAAVKIGMIGLLFALGVALARTVAPLIPEDIREETGSTSPSILIGLTTVVIGSLISMLWGDHRQAVVMGRFNARVDLAWDVYMSARLAEYRQHLRDFAEIWQGYTGAAHTVVDSIETLLRDDLEIRRSLMERRRAMLRGPLGQAVALIKGLRKGREAAAPADLPPPPDGNLDRMPRGQPRL